MPPRDDRPFLDAGCGVHETRGGQPCWWCPHFKKLLARESRVAQRTYFNPDTHVAGRPIPFTRTRTTKEQS